ncbi:MAG: AAA family ATPase [Gaiellaceae bacterium]
MSEPIQETTRIYVTGACEGLQPLLEALAVSEELELLGASEHIAVAAPALAGGHLHVVLHATRSALLPVNELAAIRELTRAPVILISSSEASALLDEALGAGVADVLVLPQMVENVIFAIRKACHASRRPESPAGVEGRIVTIFSPKGGTGKTAIATNLGVALAHDEGKRALLLDLDLQFGDAAIMLGLEPDKTIFDLVVAPGELDSDKLAGYTVRHSCGLDILPAPLRPEDAELVTESKVGRLLEVARYSYEVIVVDTSPFFHGPMLSTLDRTDQLLLVACLDIPTLKNVRLGLQTLELLSFPRERVRVLLNRSTEKVGIKQRQVEEALESEVWMSIPSDRVVPLSVNRGVPAVVADPGCDFSRGVRGLARALYASEGQGRRLLNPLRA